MNAALSDQVTDRSQGSEIHTQTVKQEPYRRMWLLMTTKISWRWARRASVAAVRPQQDVTAKFAPRLNNNATMSKLPLRTASTHTSWSRNISKQALSSDSFLHITKDYSSTAGDTYFQESRFTAVCTEFSVSIIIQQNSHYIEQALETPNKLFVSHSTKQFQCHHNLMRRYPQSRPRRLP